MNTAKITKTLVNDELQHAACYEVSPPIVDDDDRFNFVYVSAVRNPFGLETMVFLTSDAEASEVDWTGLVSLKEFDHSKALAELGYTIAE